MKKILLKVTPSPETIKENAYIQMCKQATILQGIIHNKQKQKD